MDNTTKIILGVIIAVIVVVIIWQIVQLNSIGAVAASGAPSIGSGMVGGC